MRRIVLVPLVIVAIARWVGAVEVGGLSPAVGAFVKHDYQQAIEFARRAVDSGKDNEEAWRIIGASECLLKNQAHAEEAYQKLGKEGRALLSFICARSKMSVPATRSGAAESAGGAGNSVGEH